MRMTPRSQRLQKRSRSASFLRLEDRLFLSATPYGAWVDEQGALHAPLKMPASQAGTAPARADTAPQAASAQAAAAAAYNPSITPIGAVTASKGTGEKPQSKLWFYDNHWFSVFPNNSGTQVWRLDGQSWTQVFTLTSKKYEADVKLVGNLAHILLADDDGSKLASIQYKPSNDTWEFWSQRSSLTSVPLSSKTETATLEVDSTGRLWVASDASTTIEVRYSDGPYKSFSGPIILASGVDTDDISAITTLGGNKIGVMWSNQKTKRFGFRTHQDGANPNTWSSDEVPARSVAQNVGAGMADDHINFALAGDGTLYVAIKTGYEKKGLPTVGLLVRRSSGVWDQALYQVTSKSGTRPTVVLDEVNSRIIVAYRQTNSDGPIVYKDSPRSSISFGSEKVLIAGVELNDVTSTKQSGLGQYAFIAAGDKTVKGAVLVGSSSAPLVKNATPHATLASTSQPGGSTAVTGTLNGPAVQHLIQVAKHALVGPLPALPTHGGVELPGSLLLSALRASRKLGAVDVVLRDGDWALLERLKA